MSFSESQETEKKKTRPKYTSEEQQEINKQKQGMSFNLIMKYDRFQPQQVYHLFQSHFSSGLYGFLKEEQFQTLIFNRPSFQNHISKLPQQFFIHSQKYLNTDHINQIIKEIEYQNTKFLPILRFCELKNKGQYFDHQEQDQLLIQYFFFNENSSKLLNYESFLKCNLNIQQGGQQNQESLKQQLITLPNVKFKINLNKELQLYLADIFLDLKHLIKELLLLPYNFYYFKDYYMIIQLKIYQKVLNQLLDRIDTNFIQSKNYLKFYLIQMSKPIIHKIKKGQLNINNKSQKIN